MTRRKKVGLRSRRSTINLKPSTHAFPSSPRRPPEEGHVLIIKKGEAYDIPTFGAAFAAHRFLIELLDGATLHWINFDRVRSSDGLEVYAQGLRDLMKYEDTPKEREWELPDDYVHRAQRLRSSNYAPAPIVPGASITTRVRHSRKALTTLQDLVEELGMHPRKARAILRARHEAKPERGWAWAPGAELDRIKALLKGSA